MSATIANSLPNDVETLRRMLIERDTVIAQRDATIAEREAHLARVSAERDLYKARLLAELRRIFGPRTERLDPKQLALFVDEICEVRAGIDVEVSEPQPEDGARTKRKPKRRPLPADLPREEHVHELPEEEKACPCCGEERLVIARDASEQLEYVPAKLVVHRDVQLVYACPSCRGQVQRAEKPHRAIERSIAGPSLLAHLVTAKFEDHVPLYRIEKILKRSGVDLPRSTQVGLLHQTATLLEPLVKLMWKQVRGSPLIHTDDTTMPTQDKGRGRTKTGRLWPYVGRRGSPWDRRGTVMVVEYTASRRNEHVIEHLDDWSGVLQADCFAGYCAIDADPKRPIAHAACWAHARRKFHEARTVDVARAMKALGQIKALYAIESEMREAKLEPEAIVAKRRATSQPIVSAFMGWLESEQASGAILPKSPMGKAIAYVLGHRTAFERYLSDGRLAIDNNLAEQTIRPMVVGRKNFLFAGSERGGRTMATLMSVVGSARLQQLDVAAYLGDVIRRIAAIPVNRLPELLPENWKAARRDTSG